MTADDRRPRKNAPASAPPEVSALETNWDDDTLPGLDLDDPLNEFDRVTAIPDLPSEQYAKKVMASVDEPRSPDGSTVPPPLEAAEFSFDSTPPISQGFGGVGHGRASSAQTAQTARPGAVERAVTRHIPTPTGLELADLSFDSIPAQAASTANAQRRDLPELELELELDHLAQAPSSNPEPDPSDDSGLREMKDRFAMGDFTGALAVAEGILAADPQDLPAARYAQSCRAVLTQMYSARLGSFEQFVRVAVPNDQIRWLTLDHRAGFLLSLIDGSSTVDQILDMSGMTRLDTLRIMYQLLDQRVISLDS